MNSVNPEINPWTTLHSEEIYSNPWISLSEHKVLNPAGGKGIYGVVNFKNLAIGILPLDSEYNTWLVGQYRYPLNSYSWEIPEGGGKLNVNPLESAKRELLEETGLIAEEWQLILEMHLSNSVSDEKALLYVAKNLTQKEAQPEETEQLVVKKMPFSQAYQMVLSGEITDAMSVGTILKAKLLIAEGKL